MPGLSSRALAYALCAAAVLTHAPAAHACGSCVAPVSVSVVTDHRVVLSLSSSRTVLWDQFRAAGDGAEFAWIFPVRDRNAVEVSVGSAAFVDALDLASAPLFSPSALCPSSAASTAGPTAPFVPLATPFVDAPSHAPVSVARIDGSDPTNVLRWIADQGYADPAARDLPDAAVGGPAVPDAIRQYAALRLDFIALRFRPEPGARQIPPVRISVPGYEPTLPLRGVAVGASDSVGLTLMVLADGRVDVGGSLRLSGLTLRGDTPEAAYRDAYTRLSTDGSTPWVIETAVALTPSAFAGLGAGSSPSAGDALTPAGARDDLALAFGARASVTVTRLRAQLEARSLETDLTIEPAAASAEVPRAHTYVSANPALCAPSVPDASSTPPSWGQPPSGCQCALGPSRAAGRPGAAALTMLVALAVAQGRARSRSRGAARSHRRFSELT